MLNRLPLRALLYIVAGSPLLFVALSITLLYLALGSLADAVREQQQTGIQWSSLEETREKFSDFDNAASNELQPFAGAAAEGGSPANTRRVLGDAADNLTRSLVTLRSFDAESADVVGEAIRRIDEDVVEFSRNPTPTTSLMANRLLQRAVVDTQRRLNARGSILRNRLDKAGDSQFRWLMIRSMMLGMAAVALMMTIGGWLLLRRRVIAPLEKIGLQINTLERTPILPTPAEPVGDELGAVSRALLLLTQGMIKLRREAFEDGPTGLASRYRMTQILRQFEDSPQPRPFALFFVALRDFDAINEAFGQAFAERVVGQAGIRLAKISPGQLICRYNTGTLALLMPMPDGEGSEIPLHDRAALTAKHILRGLSEPVDLDGHHLASPVHIGIALHPLDGRNAVEITTAADAAMHRARHDREKIHFATRGLSEKARSRLLLMGDIRRAVSAGEFEPFFQPIVDVKQQRVVGVESLLRWRHPDEGLILPERFLTIADDADLTAKITVLIFEESCRIAAHWRTLGIELTMACNLPPQSLRPGIVERIAGMLARHGVPPETFDIEILETALMERPEEAVELATQLRGLGVGLCLDDFGTGYSSLSYVQRFPITKIKIDRSFINEMDSSRTATKIISATSALAASLGIQIIAEGVETREQRDRLISFGCTRQQGFYFGVPMPANDFVSWYQNRQWKEKLVPPAVKLGAASA